jgi:uncharacterized membrane protein
MLRKPADGNYKLLLNLKTKIPLTYTNILYLSQKKEAPVSKIERYFSNREKQLSIQSIRSSSNETIIDLNMKDESEGKNIIRQFGYSIFNKNNTYSNLSNLPISSDYKLGSGDILSVYIWGKIESQLDLTIDPKGRIYLAQI